MILDGRSPDAIAQAATRGGQGAAQAAGVDLGAMAEPPVEEIVAEPAAVEAAVAEPVAEA